MNEKTLDVTLNRKLIIGLLKLLGNTDKDLFAILETDELLSGARGLIVRGAVESMLKSFNIIGAMK